LLLPANMLRAGEPVLLDGITLQTLCARLHVPIIPFADGADLVRILTE
jgi:hypothetical protein